MAMRTFNDIKMLHIKAAYLYPLKINNKYTQKRSEEIKSRFKLIISG